MNLKDLKSHIAATYWFLRVGNAALAALLPFVLYFGGALFANLPLQSSISAYYHAGGGALRDVFVGVLCAVGSFLVLYKGYTAFEDRALNLAGILLAGVAWIPMQWGCGDSCHKISLHAALAVLFFLAIGYVCIFRAGDTLDLIENPALKRLYDRTYKAAGVLLIASPALAVVLSFSIQPESKARPTVFFVESLGILVFAGYWIVKSFEIKKTHSERLGMENELVIPAYGKSSMFKRIPIRRKSQSGMG